MCDSLKIIVPADYTALAGDLEIHVQGLLSQNIVHHAQLLEYYPKDNSVTIVTSTPITFDYNSSAESRSVVWKARFRCGIITQGGRYAFRIHLNPSEHRNSANVLVSESNRSTDEEILSISKRQHVLIKEAQQMGENVSSSYNNPRSIIVNSEVLHLFEVKLRAIGGDTNFHIKRADNISVPQT